MLGNYFAFPKVLKLQVQTRWLVARIWHVVAAWQALDFPSYRFHWPRPWAQTLHYVDCMNLIDETKMTRVFVESALIFGWVSMGRAQVSIDPATKRVGTKVEEPKSRNSSSYHNSILGNVNPYTDRQTTIDPNRHLELHKQQGQGRSDNRTGPVFNPITFYWK